jgi:hypothetical protein
MISSVLIQAGVEHLIFLFQRVINAYYLCALHVFHYCVPVQREGVFFISGDVHFGEISRYDCATGYPLYDVTASGLTQAVEKAVPHVFSLIVRFVAWLTPTTMRVISTNCRFKSCTYGKEWLFQVSFMIMLLVLFLKRFLVYQL